MRIDLPTCGFKSCRYCFDGNCTKRVEYDRCEYRAYKGSLQVHGRWERRFCHPMRDGEWQYVCSVCKNDNYWRNNVCPQKHRYCPNCGAKMRQEDL